MTGTEYRGRQNHKNISSAPSVTRFFSGSTIVAVLAIMASLLPGITAAQAQVRLELATVKDGKFYHKWSDNPDNPNSWSDWTSLGHPVGHVLFSTPAVVSDGVGRINFFAWGDDGLYRNTYNDNNGSWS